MRKKIKSNLPIILIIILACVVYIWGLWNEGLGNLYYAAGVFSMGQNFHAFFYNSIDSIGFISIDKPPLGLWIQVLFTKILGFNGIALLLPQALAGVLSVYFIYKIMIKRFGKRVGIVSALVLTLTPIYVAVSRNNTIDSILILMLILASEQAIKAAQKSSIKHLIYAGIFIGLGFNVKMLQAYMIVPAVYLTYLVFSKEKIIKKLISCTVSVLVLLVISLSWIMAVDLTPPENRPYVGSSTTNSALELTMGFNGLGRLIGVNYLKRSSLNDSSNVIPPKTNVQNRDMNNRPNVNSLPDTNSRRNINNPSNLKNRPDEKNNQHSNNRSGGEAGTPSIFRLYNSKNAGQISWFLLPVFIVCIFYLYLFFNKKIKDMSQNITTFYFISCFIPMYIYFSFSPGLVHRYYLAMLSFPISALIGIGVYFLKQQQKIFIPIIFAVTAILQLYIQSLYKNWLNWVVPCLIVIFIAVLVLIFIDMKRNDNKFIINYLFVLLIIPAIWSFTPIIYGNNERIPIAGPELVNQKDSSNNYVNLSNLIDFLKENKGDTDYLVAAPSAMNLGAKLILESKEPVMILGGFKGNDNPITVEDFKNLINKNVIEYALVPTSNNLDRNRNETINSSIIEWIRLNGVNLDNELKSRNGKIDGMSLYKLK
ncbi:ArnT family glycosyltransferase [Defluviitalea phaphyphila]|uniref:glycosyltransferase family 39 protein n=1 Tax=Defluviitalea phaphyphila TaxID=1473580 RepID=UPI0007301CB4|nr:glycosyltransferase family 39 protein [Defluviitalea phaphyphila]